MAHTVFTNGITLSDAVWFNDIDTVAYTYFGNGTNLNAPTQVAVTKGVFSTSVITPLIGTDTAANLILKTNGVNGWAQNVAAAPTWYPTADGTQNLGAITNRIAGVFAGSIDSGSGTLILKGAGSTALTITGANAVFAGTIASGQITANLTGNVTGNASTVTTNANLTGPITSVGNVTSIASGNTYASPTFTGTVSGTPTWASNQAITLSTAAQTNVTSLGSLTSLTMAGTLTVGANTLALASSTVSGTPTWSSNQAITLSTAAQANVTSLGTLTSLTTSGTVTMTAAASKIVPGATSFSHRNNADNADNILIADNGNTTVRGTLTATGGFVGIPGITLATEQASTSGTSIDFTGIPAGVKRITVMFSGVSISGVSPMLIQIGSGSFDTTGYLSGVALVTGTAGQASSTAGFRLNLVPNASDLHHGQIVLSLERASTNNWVASGLLYRESGTGVILTAGQHALAGAIDRVRITTTAGTDTFDAGLLNISYES